MRPQNTQRRQLLRPTSENAPSAPHAARSGPASRYPSSHRISTSSPYRTAPPGSAVPCAGAAYAPHSTGSHRGSPTSTPGATHATVPFPAAAYPSSHTASARPPIASGPDGDTKPCAGAAGASHTTGSQRPPCGRPATLVNSGTRQQRVY